MDRLRALTYGTVLLLIVGWVLYAGKAIFVPAVLGAVIVYVIVGLAHALGRLPTWAARCRCSCATCSRSRRSAWSASCSPIS